MLLAASDGKPRQSDLRRAVSTAYYALFHCLAQCCADSLIGGGSADKSQPAWKQVYRALQHGPAKDACVRQAVMKRFPKAVEDFGNMFVTMQKKRHDADYDPEAKHFKSGVMADVRAAESIIIRFNQVPMKHKRAFAAWVLLRPPRS